MASTDNNQPIQAKVDEWKYASVTLPNGLQALLISDPTTDKAAAAMDVRTA
jgi:insulysin